MEPAPQPPSEHDSIPAAKFVPTSGEYKNPVVVEVTPEEFQKLRDKQWIAVFMSPTQADSYELWKLMEEDKAPKNTGPKPQDKETKLGLDSAKKAAA